MTRARAIAGSVLFLVLAPGGVMVLVPWLICRWRFQPPLLGFAPFRVVGVALLIVGAAGMLDSFARFALQGLGTPAPVAPPQRLVVTGMYRYVRNPMYVAGVCLVMGEALLFGSAALLGYGLLAWLVTHLFVVFYEEPTLRKMFGEEFSIFCANVPRWIPRLRPWQPPPRSSAQR